jgi:hypothetical protein
MTGSATQAWKVVQPADGSADGTAGSSLSFESDGLGLTVCAAAATGVTASKLKAKAMVSILFTGLTPEGVTHTDELSVTADACEARLNLYLGGFRNKLVFDDASRPVSVITGDSPGSISELPQVSAPVRA